jgi:hypothetical protein
MRQLPHKVVEGLTTKSAKIRALAAAGYERTEIRDHLKISYQHVNNVLLQSGTNRAPTAASRKPAATLTPPQQAVAWRSEQLLASGFELLGEWRSTGETGFELSASAPTDAGVYAFAVDGAVRYIGLTQTAIRTRLGHYVYGHAQQRTSARVKALILEALANG